MECTSLEKIVNRFLPCQKWLTIIQDVNYLCWKLTVLSCYIQYRDIVELLAERDFNQKQSVIFCYNDYLIQTCLYFANYFFNLIAFLFSRHISVKYVDRTGVIFLLATTSTTVQFLWVPLFVHNFFILHNLVVTIWCTKFPLRRFRI